MTLASSASWEMPEPLAVHEVRMPDGAAIILRCHGNPDGRRLVLSHGNGLAIDLYYPFWSLLLDDFDLIVYDLRNHGWNAVGDMSTHNVPTFALDTTAFSQPLTTCTGRSPQPAYSTPFPHWQVCCPPRKAMPLRRACCSIRPCAGRASASTNSRPPRRAPPRRCGGVRIGSGRARSLPRPCRSCPSSLAPFRESMSWSPGPRSAPVPAGTGYELRCPRDFEAQIIDYSGVYALLVDLQALGSPTKVIGADPTLPYSFLPTFDCSDIAKVDYDFIPEATHLLQLERPQECAAATREFLNRVLTRERAPTARHRPASGDPHAARAVTKARRER